MAKAFQAEASTGISLQGWVGRLGQEGKGQDVADVIGSGTKATKPF